MIYASSWYGASVTSSVIDAEVDFEQFRETDDPPGTGTNLLNDGETCIWKQSSTGDVFQVTRIGSQYFYVELTTP